MRKLKGKEEKKDEDVPQAKELAPSCERIKKAVCDFYMVLVKKGFWFQEEGSSTTP